MKQVFDILYAGLRNPRFYIETLSLKRTHFRLLAFLGTLIMSVVLSITTWPTMSHIMTSVSDASDVVPAYTVTDKQVSIDPQAKPVYYQSEYFQLVVDDTVLNSADNLEFELPKEKANLIKANTLLNVFIFKKHAYAIVGGRVFNLTELIHNSPSQTVLVQWLKTFDSYMPVMLGSLIVTSFIMSFVGYVLLMLIIALFANVFNRSLKPTLNFKTRLKLTMMVSLVPLFVTELAGLVIPIISDYAMSIIIVLTLVILYAMFRQHTKFLMELFKNSNND